MKIDSRFRKITTDLDFMGIKQTQVGRITKKYTEKKEKIHGKYQENLDKNYETYVDDLQKLYNEYKSERR